MDVEWCYRAKDSERELGTTSALPRSVLWICGLVFNTVLVTVAESKDHSSTPGDCIVNVV